MAARHRACLLECAAMSRRAALVVVAAGTGSRLGAEQHKALVELGGRPLVERTVLRLLAEDWLDPVVLVGHADDLPALKQLAGTWPRTVTVVSGGARRQDSVASGLFTVMTLPDPPEVVLVHDAARPFPPCDALGQLADAAAAHGAALLAVPVADTLKQQTDADTDGRAGVTSNGASNGRAEDPAGPADALVRTTVPRAGLWAAQTPQAFRRNALLDRLALAESEGRTVTDEAALFEEQGEVALVRGSSHNFKITTMDDLRLAEALLPLQQRESSP